MPSAELRALQVDLLAALVEGDNDRDRLQLLPLARALDQKLEPAVLPGVLPFFGAAGRVGVELEPFAAVLDFSTRTLAADLDHILVATGSRHPVVGERLRSRRQL